MRWKVICPAHEQPVDSEVEEVEGATPQIALHRSTWGRDIPKPAVDYLGYGTYIARGASGVWFFVVALWE